MKTITITQSTCADDGKKNPAFSVRHSGHNLHAMSANGVIITRQGVNAAVLLSWEQIDALCAQHEPLLALKTK